jgi:hypothetical protein
MERLDYDPLTGLSTFVDFADGKMSISQTQDVSASLDANVKLQNDPEFRKHGMKESFLKVASIDPIVQLAWLNEGIDVLNPDHWPRVRAKLNDPDWSKVRTTVGRV